MAKRFLAFLLNILLLFPYAVQSQEETVLKLGDSGEAVLELNTRLRQLNYSMTPASPQYTTSTQKAVSALQAAYGLSVTGQADIQTITVLYGECYRPLSLGMNGEDVAQLQEKLAELGYYSGNVTGNYLDGTTAAVQLFQSECGLDITGTADVKTQETLYSISFRPTPSPTPAPTPGQTARPAATPGPFQPFPRKLRYGDTGADVQMVQQRLMDLGFFTYPKVTNGYYKNSQAAVESFQASSGLKVTGEVDEQTWNLLFNAAYLQPAEEPEKQTASPTAQNPNYSYAPAPTPGAYQPYKQTFSKGDTNEAIQRIQQRLMDLGFFTYPKITSYFGDNTQQAVEAFQAHNSLKVTGSVNKDTWNAIFNDITTVSASNPPKPSYVLPYFFEVDIRNQVVKVWKYNYETDGYTDLDRAFLVATGTTTYPTPLGTYTLSGRKAAHCKFPKWGGGEARWWTKITEEIAFHSVLYGDSSDDSTLKVNSLTGLGKRGSHGCIRMTVADAKWVYDHVEEGMQVWIHEDADADPELRYAIQPGALNKKSMMPNVTPEPPAYTYDGHHAPDESARSLNVGKEGEDVYWLQSKLKELGYYKGTVTGQYREGTEKAVRAYQYDRGLSGDGVAGMYTLRYLYNEVRQANATPAPSPTPSASSTPVPSYAIEP